MHAQWTFPGVAPRRTLIGIIVLSVVAAATISSAQVYHNWRSFGPTPGFDTIFAVKLIEWSLWAAAVPLIVWLDRTRGFQRRNRPAAVMMHLAAAVGWFLAVNSVLTLLALLTDPQAADTTFRSMFTNRLIFKLPGGLGVYGFVLAAYGVVHLFSERYRQSLRESQLETELNAARLRSLQMQLQPHFLFNTLHSIGGLVREGDGDKAVDMIAELSELLRRALNTADHQEVMLDEELDFLDHYVRIQQVRFADRLRVRYAIEPTARSALIPSLLLQPLVENAVRHGLERTGRNVEITIAARSSGDRLVIEVADTGPGLNGARVVEGVGLGTTRQRLGQMYGARQSLELSDNEGSGALVRVSLPYRTTRVEEEGG